MVKMSASYQGGLHCELSHEPSGSKIETDAPKDNNGKGEKFSPTDLVGAALASCLLTVMGIVAERDGVSLAGTKAEVQKEMISTPTRRIASLAVQVTLPAHLAEPYRQKLERVALQCPVHESLHPDLKMPITFVYL